MIAKAGRAVLHGWLVIDKPAAMTSAAVVGAVRRATHGVKAGHAGTLDPLATGVLPIALGEATKTMSYAMDGRKKYRFCVRWGEQRDTDDSEGAIIATSEVRPGADAIAAVLPQFQGDIEQVPPTYSAIKVAGRRAYALARAHEPITLAARTVTVEAIELVSIPDPDHAIFAVVAGKGVYMRALARDLAQLLGTVGHIAWLRRLAVGPFTEQQATSLDALEAAADAGKLADLILPVQAALADIPALPLTEVEARQLRQGRPVAALPVARRSSFKGIDRDAMLCAMAEGKLVALVQIRGGEIRPVRVLNI